jgi:hypothetical protein
MQKCNLECNWCNDDWDVIGIEIMKKMIWIWWRKKFLEMQVTKIKLKKGKNGKYGLLWSCHAKTMQGKYGLFCANFDFFNLKKWLCWLFSQSVNFVDFF